MKNAKTKSPKHTSPAVKTPEPPQDMDPSKLPVKQKKHDSDSEK